MSGAIAHASIGVALSQILGLRLEMNPDLSDYTIIGCSVVIIINFAAAAIAITEVRQ